MEYKFIKVDKKDQGLKLKKYEHELLDELRYLDKSKYNHLIRKYFEAEKNKILFLNRLDELFEIYRNSHIYELLPLPRRNISHALGVIATIQSEYFDPLTDIRAYLSNEGRLILNFLSKEYKNPSPKEFAVMVYALKELKWVQLNNLSAFYKVAKKTFGAMGSCENLRQSLERFQTSVKHKEFINKTIKTFKEELGKIVKS